MMDRLTLAASLGQTNDFAVEVSRLWFPDEAKVETEQEKDEMDDGAATTDLRCFDKARPQQRHRNIGEIEIK